MRKLNGFIYCCVLAMMCGTASAQIKIHIDGQEIPTEDIESITILPQTSVINIITTGYTIQANDAVPADPDAVSITFSQSASSITTDQSVALNWSTVNASSCTTSGGTGGWDTLNVGPDGSEVITIAIAGTYIFTLTCGNDSGGSAVESKTVIVSAPTTTKTCSTPPLSGTVMAWEGFWSDNFPLPIQEDKFLTIPIKGYTAFKFNTGDINDDGKMSNVETTITDGVRLGSFSECPGDFDVVPECRFVWGLSGGIRWATNGLADACQLKPNTTYYFNITFTDGVDSSVSSCGSIPCVTNMQYRNR